MIVYLVPRSPFTKGVIRSDTLFGGIAWAIRWLYGERELEQLLEEFDVAIRDQSAPPFVLSSLFPYFEDTDGRILFLPRPISPPVISRRSAGVKFYQTYKQMLRASFVSKTVFERISNGDIDDAHILDGMMRDEDSEYHLQANGIMTRDERVRVKLPALFTHSETARNAINRITFSTGDGGELYYEPITASFSLSSSMRCGFYLLIKVGGYRAEQNSGMLKAAMRFLADKGLGGDSSIGRGHCEVSFDDNDVIKDHSEGSRIVTLSLLHPSATDREHLAKHKQVTFARLERRKGFIESVYANEVKQVWKPTLFMLGEGATFPRDGERKVYGTLFTEENKREGLDFRVRINGMAYTLGLRGEAAQ